MTPIRLVQSGDQQIAVYRWGTPDSGPTVVLVHGYPDSADVWQPIAERLAEHFHVLAYDVRGCGHSSVPSNTAQYELSYLVEDLAAVLDQFSPNTPIHLVAHDWGSIQCWEAVTTARLQGRIASYTSLSGPSLDHVSQWLHRNWRERDPVGMAKTVKQLMHSWYIGFFHLPRVAPALWRIGMDEWFPKMIERREGSQLSPSEHRRKDGINGIELYRANIVPRFKQPRERFCDVPVQVLVATRDPFVTPLLIEDLHRWVPKLWRRDINTGHWGVASHPDLISRYITEFIQFIDTGREPGVLKFARVNDEPEREFSRKLAVITGAGSGIGRETTLMLAKLGATVIAADLNLDAAKETAALADADAARVIAQKVDVSSEKQMEKLANWVEKEYGAPDIVVNNAGIGIAGRFLDTSVKDWDKVLKVNLWGVIHGSRLFGEQMVRHAKAGHIVNLASMAAYTPMGFMSAYATSKAAVLMLSDCLRADFAPFGIRVSSICPGIVDTAITSHTRFVGVDEAEEAARQSRAKAKYQKRNLQPTAVADAILKALRANRADVRVGAEAEVSRWVSRWLPGVTRKLAQVKVKL